MQYRLLYSKPSGSTYLTTSVEMYADKEMSELLLSGDFEEKSMSVLELEPEMPIACDRLILKLTGNRYIGLNDDHFTVEFKAGFKFDIER